MTNCLWCKKALPSRRKEMAAPANQFCTNRCMLKMSENVLLQADPSFGGSAPPGSDPNVAYIKIPKYIPKRPPPNLGSSSWDYLTWITMEMFERYKDVYKVSPAGQGEGEGNNQSQSATNPHRRPPTPNPYGPPPSIPGATAPREQFSYDYQYYQQNGQQGGWGQQQQQRTNTYGQSYSHGQSASSPPSSIYERERDELFQYFGLANTSTLEDAEKIYRARAKQVHPDLPGGNAQKMSELNQVITRLRALMQ